MCVTGECGGWLQSDSSPLRRRVWGRRVCWTAACRWCRHQREGWQRRHGTALGFISRFGRLCSSPGQLCRCADKHRWCTSLDAAVVGVKTTKRCMHRCPSASQCVTKHRRRRRPNCSGTRRSCSSRSRTWCVHPSSRSINRSSWPVHQAGQVAARSSPRHSAAVPRRLSTAAASLSLHHPVVSRVAVSSARDAVTSVTSSAPAVYSTAEIMFTVHSVTVSFTDW